MDAQRTFFGTDTTKPYEFRLDALKKLQDGIIRHENDILDALAADLGKTHFEGYMTEVGLVREDLRHAIKNLKKWMRPQRKSTPFAHFPSKSRIFAEPFGVTLVMSPWNYPFQLTMEPLIGALAAGNCAVLKPSNYSPNTSDAIAMLMKECFAPEYVTTVLGGRQQNGDLLKQRFDYIFFTGGITVGKLVMQSAAENLTPVTLELGGKSPCIVDASADIPLAAKRIVFGKFINSGQTCIAPDYCYVHESKKDELVRHMIASIEEFYTKDALGSPVYPHIVNDKHYARLMGLMDDGSHVLYGGAGDPETKKIQPTLLDGVTWDSPVMGQEIFGPLLPIMAFRDIGEVVDAVKLRERPLALYLFATDEAVKRRVVRSISYGGGCINDTIIHIATTQLPFGGVGQSGMGSYHGKKSFDTFTHHKSVLEKSNALDIGARYLPGNEKKFKAIRRFIH